MMDEKIIKDLKWKIYLEDNEDKLSKEEIERGMREEKLLRRIFKYENAQKKNFFKVIIEEEGLSAKLKKVKKRRGRNTRTRNKQKVKKTETVSKEDIKVYPTSKLKKWKNKFAVVRFTNKKKAFFLYARCLEQRKMDGVRKFKFFWEDWAVQDFEEYWYSDEGPSQILWLNKNLDNEQRKELSEKGYLKGLEDYI